VLLTTIVTLFSNGNAEKREQEAQGLARSFRSLADNVLQILLLMIINIFAAHRVYKYIIDDREYYTLRDYVSSHR
jgi:hypothetical protein